MVNFPVFPTPITGACDEVDVFLIVVDPPLDHVDLLLT